MFLLVHKEDAAAKYIQDGYIFNTVEDAARYAMEDMQGTEVEIYECVSKYEVSMKVELNKVVLKNEEMKDE